MQKLITRITITHFSVALLVTVALSHAVDAWMKYRGF